MRKGDWMQTQSGIEFWPMSAKCEEIHLEDIAHALSQICRFGGHTKAFYSVAQHSVLVSRYCSPENALWGLLHDATEAYLGDIIRPLKLQGSFDFYRQVEEELMAVICERFGLPLEQPTQVTEMDNRVLHTEKRDLLAHDMDWLWSAPTLPEVIVPLLPTEAKRLFIDRFNELVIR